MNTANHDFTAKTLYEQRRDVWQGFIETGFPSLGAMAKRFLRPADMDRALGYQNAVARWHNRGGVPEGTAEVRATKWLANHQPDATAPEPPTDKPAAPMMLVACDPASIAKVQRVLALMGCEVIEI